MGESYVGLPTDGSGKKVRTRQRVISANTVEEQYYIKARDRVLDGSYFGSPGIASVTVGADAAGAGRWWLHNPIAGVGLIAVTRLRFRSQTSATTVALTTPRIAVKRFATSANGTGTAITPTKRDTSETAQVAKYVSASTSLVQTDGALVAAFFPPVILTGVGVCPPTVDDVVFDELNPLILRPTEGIYCQQLDAGTTSDPRKYIVEVWWEEFTLP